MPLIPFFLLIFLFLFVITATWWSRKARERKLIMIYTKVYIKAYPRVLLRVTKDYNLAKTGTLVNQFYFLREFPTPAFKSVVAPNVNTLYGSAFLDLSRGPLVLHIPAVPDHRYFLVTYWMRTPMFSSIPAPGPRVMGSKIISFAILPVSRNFLFCPR